MVMEEEGMVMEEEEMVVEVMVMVVEEMEKVVMEMEEVGMVMEEEEKEEEEVAVEEVRQEAATRQRPQSREPAMCAKFPVHRCTHTVRIRYHNYSPKNRSMLLCLGKVWD